MMACLQIRRHVAEAIYKQVRQPRLRSLPKSMGCCLGGHWVCNHRREAVERSHTWTHLLYEQVLIGDIIDPAKCDAVTSILMGTAWHLDLEQIRPMRNQSAGRSCILAGVHKRMATGKRYIASVHCGPSLYACPF